MGQKKPKKLRDLNLLSRFLFDEVMDDTETYSGILEILLGRAIRLKGDSHSEKEIRTIPTFRGIRLDVWGQDEEGAVYNSEMQTADTKNLPRRSRFYQSVLDAGLLEPGTVNFNQLSDVYLITIAPFDLFGQNRCRYTFRMRCDEDTGLTLEDGAKRMFFYTRGEAGTDESPELIQFLRYVEQTTDKVASEFDSPRLKRLYERVQDVKSNEGIEVKYMQLWEEKLMERMEGEIEGERKGEAIGEAYFAALTERLLKDSKKEDLLKAVGDKVYREELYKAYGIKDKQ